MRPPPGTRLCRLEEIPEPGAKGFSFGSGRDFFALFAVRHAGQLHLYVNECPHAYTTLDAPDDHFLNAAGTEILCSTHGARFTLDRGLCIAGPCQGRSLQRLPGHVEDGWVILGSKAG